MCGSRKRYVIFHLLSIPAAADTEQKAPLRHLVRDATRLCSLYRVALYNQADSSAELELLGDAPTDVLSAVEIATK